MTDVIDDGASEGTVLVAEQVAEDVHTAEAVLAYQGGGISVRMKNSGRLDADAIPRGYHFEAVTFGHSEMHSGWTTVVVLERDDDYGERADAAGGDR